MKLVCNTIAKHIVGADLDFEKMKKLCADAKYSKNDMEVLVACVMYIMKNATRYDVDSETLANELQQLGLPKEHSQSLCKSFGSFSGKLRDHLGKQTLKVNALESYDWKVDYVIGSSQVESIQSPQLSLKLKVESNADEIPREVTAVVDKNLLDLLVLELQEACEIMNRLES
eukprot:m.3498 g.3498  ORF g.3498 m.3498 type:complete len:172 (-) comp3556_c0_seq1:61-576(-)